MILGASGQNIYPEEIEEKLNSSPFIAEALAIQENNKIVALIFPDNDALKEHQINPENHQLFFEDQLKEINAKLPAYSKISSFRFQDKEFEKTPKRSIRRFKYQK